MNIRSNIFCLALGLISLIVIPSTSYGQLSGSSYAKAKSTKQAHLVFNYVDIPGFVHKEKNGQFSGLSAEMMKDFVSFLKEKKGITATYKFSGKNATSFPGYLEEIKISKGAVFGISNTTITNERKKTYKFSTPYMSNMIVLMSHKDVPTMDNLADIKTKFAGMRAITTKHSTNEKLLKNIKKKYWPEMKIEYAETFWGAMDILEKDRKVFTTQDLAFYLDALDKKKPYKRHPAGDSPKEYYGIIMPINSDWTPVINEFLKSYTNSMRYKKVITENLGAHAIKFITKF